jgi:hypothetical protein
MEGREKGRYKWHSGIDHIFNFSILLWSERTAYSYVCFFCFAAGADGSVEVLSREKLMFVFYLLDMSEMSFVLYPSSFRRLAVEFFFISESL